MFTVISRKIQSAVCMILSAVIVSCQPVARCLRRRTRCARRLLGDDHADPVSPRPLPALPFKARRQALALAAQIGFHEARRDGRTGLHRCPPHKRSPNSNRTTGVRVLRR